MAKLKVVVPKSHDQKYARTQANKDRRAARLVRELAKAAASRARREGTQ